MASATRPARCWRATTWAEAPSARPPTSARQGCTRRAGDPGFSPMTASTRSRPQASRGLTPVDPVRCLCSPRVIRKITGTLVLLLALSASPALASTHTWTGAVDQNWSTPGNWTGGAPTTGESGGTVVSFPAGSTSTMDISGLVVDQINFTGSGSTIGGSTPLGVNGAHFITDINDANGGNTIAAPV